MLNTLNQFVGVLIVVVYSLFSIAALWIVLAPIKSLSRPLTFIGQCINFYSQNEAARKLIQPNNEFHTTYNVFNLVLAYLSFSFIFILTLFLPHVWAITTMPVQAWNAYFTVDSPYSLVHNVILYQSDKIVRSVQDFIADDVYMLIKQDYLPDPNWLQPTVYLKLYETVIVYYAIIFTIIAFGTTGTYYTPLRRILHKRVNMMYIPKIINLWPLGASVGERCFCFSITTIMMMSILITILYFLNFHFLKILVMNATPNHF
jgi:hypothetical protein